jgi:outer membrane protein assembly factor BamB
MSIQILPITFRFLIVMVSLTWIACAGNQEKVVRHKPLNVKKEEVLIRKAWSKSLPPGSPKKRYYPELASPVWSDDHVVVGTQKGFLWMLDAANKFKIIWKHKSLGPVAAPALVHGDKIFYGTRKGMFWALDRSTGNELWKAELNAEILSSPVIHEGIVYVMTEAREIYALRQDSGQELWSAYVPGYDRIVSMQGEAALVVSGARLWAAMADGQLVVMDTKSGKLIHKKMLADYGATFRDIDARIVVDGKYVFVSGYFGYLYKLRMDTLETVWKRELTIVQDMTVLDSMVIAATHEGNLVGLDKETGYRRWELALHAGLLSTPAVWGSWVFVASEKAGAYLADVSTGKALQRLSADPIMGSPSVRGDTLVALSDLGKLSAFKIVDRLHKSRRGPSFQADQKK